MRQQLLLLPDYNLFDWLESGSTATRSRSTEKLPALLKSDAENAVKGIEGVESVQNNIEVLLPSPDDDRIRLAEYHPFMALMASTATAGTSALDPRHRQEWPCDLAWRGEFGSRQEENGRDSKQGVYQVCLACRTT